MFSFDYIQINPLAATTELGAIFFAPNDTFYHAWL